MQRTEDLLDKFRAMEQSRNSQQACKDVKGMYKTIDDRYYVPRISAKNKIGAVFTAKVLDAINVPKHVRVRRNAKEKGKLDYIADEMKNSPRLRQVESDIEDFED